MVRHANVAGRLGRLVAALAILAGVRAVPGTDGPDLAAPKLPSLQEAVKGFTQVTPSDGGTQSMYTLYVKPGTRDILALLPRAYEQQTLLFGNGVAGGLATAGIQGDTHLVRWKRVGDRLALIKPQLRIRTSGDAESVKSHEELFTDFSILDVPIVAEGEGGAPVIALDDLLVDRSKLFYTWIPGDLEPMVAVIKKIKVFGDNLSIAFEMPWRINLDHPDHGQLVTISYSLSVLPDPSGYTPRKADPRVGYFVTAWHDLARIGDPSPRQRYIKRWMLEKADPKLAHSPPRQPIVFYIDHTTPIRYRGWVREGILEWNKAFAEVGIDNAIEVYQQDAVTGAHMDKDPESINFNFLVWNSNDISFAIGPCRVDPKTGRILDADVVMNDGWLRVAADSYRKYLAGSMVEGLDSVTLDWLGAHPHWDPRVRWAEAGIGAAERPVQRMAGMQMARGWLEGRGAACGQADCRIMDLALARSSLLDRRRRGCRVQERRHAVGAPAPPARGPRRRGTRAGRGHARSLQCSPPGGRQEPHPASPGGGVRHQVTRAPRRPPSANLYLPGCGASTKEGRCLVAGSSFAGCSSSAWRCCWAPSLRRHCCCRSSPAARCGGPCTRSIRRRHSSSRKSRCAALSC